MSFLDCSRGFVVHCSTALEGLSVQEAAKISFRLFVQERRMSARSWRLQRQETEQIAELEFIVQHIKVYCDDHTQDVSKQDMVTTRLEGARFLPIDLGSLSSARPSSWNFAADLVKTQNCTNGEVCHSSESSMLTSNEARESVDFLRNCAEYQTLAGSAGRLAQLYTGLKKSSPEPAIAAAAAAAAAALVTVAAAAAAAGWPSWGLLS